MSLSRSTSPIPGGGWATPGLDITGGRSSPTRALSGTPAMWQQSSRLGRNHGGGGYGGGSNHNNRYPSFSTRTQGFFGRHMRRLSNSLPRFNSSPYYADKEKLGRERWSAQNATLPGRIRSILGRMGRKMKTRLLFLLILLSLLVFFNSPFVYWWRRSSWFGGGEKFVIVIGANYFAYNFRAMGSLQDIFGQLWKEYSLSDSRYLTKSAPVLCIEALTAIFWGPLSFLIAYFITTDHPLRHPLTILVSSGQLYGTVLYYATAIFDETIYGKTYSRPEAYYFYGYYVLMNSFWIVIPAAVIFNSFKAWSRTVEALILLDQEVQHGQQRSQSVQYAPQVPQVQYTGSQQVKAKKRA
ncbi:hypothetical protein VTJ49DRAFT_4846 [Mycothermus thermophilus]|uniref:EXPERA domain-containing protein n=1 Tax=Humicola insolens TaxID=85995 RepID=A0ABR3VLI4_HUMIN